ncbi:hypothetical protein MTP03_27350 [Tsukamurella sp. PLM1]|nr:hypothetical protein MTP03_27350 [Tsukamurella sp. PLM1]
MSWSTYSDSFAFRVATLRAGLGMTQDELAERSGLSRGAIQGAEYGRGGRPGEFKNPTLRTVYQLARGLGVRPIDLLPDGDRQVQIRSPEQESLAARAGVEEVLADVVRQRLGRDSVDS